MSSSSRTQNSHMPKRNLRSNSKKSHQQHQQSKSPWKDDELYKSAHEMNYEGNKEPNYQIPRQRKQRKQRKEQGNDLREGNIDTNEGEREKNLGGNSEHMYVEDGVTPEEAYWIR